jgi:urease accessory protein
MIGRSRWITTGAALGGAALASLAVAGPVAAHTGHPADGLVDGVVHPLFGPDHLLAMVAVGVVAALASSRRLAWAVPAGFLGGMVLGGVAGIAGVSFPGLEVAVAASVVALGLLVTRAAPVRAVWLPVLAGLFGAAHGLAHGGELPADARPLVYVAGFVAATAALHALGVLGGTGLRSRPAVRTALGTAVAAAGAGLVVLAG